MTKKKSKLMTPEQRKLLYAPTKVNAGVGWDRPEYRRTSWMDRYQPTDPVKYEGGKK